MKRPLKKGSTKFCKHERQIRNCKVCGGISICKHGRFRFQCKECKGSQICKHNRIRGQCKQCGGLPTLATMLYRSARQRSLQKDVPFSITVQDILKLIGNGVCPVLGITYNLSRRAVSGDSASLDRFIPRKGYIKGNCVVISELANRIKTNASAKQIQLVANWMKRLERRLK